MLINESNEGQPNLIQEGTAKPFSRRKFFGIMGAGAAVLVAASSCNKEDTGIKNNAGVDLGSGDFGILNYAYALEQLEAAFYTQIISTPYANISAM
jgi:hypothetical protein